MIVSLSHAEANLDGVATSMDKNTRSMQRGPVNGNVRCRNFCCFILRSRGCEYLLMKNYYSFMFIAFEVCRSMMYVHRACSLMLFNPFTMVTLAERR